MKIIQVNSFFREFFLLGESSHRKLIRIILRSEVYSYIGGLVAIAMFTLTDQAISFIIIREPEYIYKYLLFLVGAMFIIGTLLSIIPIGFGAIIFAYFVNWISIRKENAVHYCAIAGSLIGTFIVLIISFVVIGYFWSIGKGSFIRMIVWTVEAAIYGALAGGWIGLKLSKYAQSLNRPALDPPPSGMQ